MFSHGQFFNNELHPINICQCFDWRSKLYDWRNLWHLIVIYALRDFNCYMTYKCIICLFFNTDYTCFLTELTAIPELRIWNWCWNMVLMSGNSITNKWNCCSQGKHTSSFARCCHLEFLSIKFPQEEERSLQIIYAWLLHIYFLESHFWTNKS